MHPGRFSRRFQDQLGGVRGHSVEVPRRRFLNPFQSLLVAQEWPALLPGDHHLALGDELFHPGVRFVHMSHAQLLGAVYLLQDGHAYERLATGDFYPDAVVMTGSNVSEAHNQLQGRYSTSAQPPLDSPPSRRSLRHTEQTRPVPLCPEVCEIM